MFLFLFVMRVTEWRYLYNMAAYCSSKAFRLGRTGVVDKVVAFQKADWIGILRAGWQFVTYITVTSFVRND